MLNEKEMKRINSMGIPLTTTQWTAIKIFHQKDFEWIVKELNRIHDSDMPYTMVKNLITKMKDKQNE